MMKKGVAIGLVFIIVIVVITLAVLLLVFMEAKGGLSSAAGDLFEII